jgi:hypothetical protein
VEGGRVLGCGRPGVEGMEMRRWVARASGTPTTPRRVEKCIVGDVTDVEDRVLMIELSLEHAAVVVTSRFGEARFSERS